ncbi:MAG TPA: hypothetical protein VGL10_02055, partial [Gammaproteobacteria bacterium]
IQGVSVVHSDPDIRFNQIEIGEGGELLVSFASDEEEEEQDDEFAASLVIEEEEEQSEQGLLDIHQALLIEEDGRLTVAPIYSNNRGRSHGGDADGWAYDSVREPRFPGSSSWSRGGGSLEIVVPELTNNGRIRADGEELDYGYTGAGGSLLIRAQRLQGQGIISANGGDIRLNEYGAGGAGGRIAVYYADYNGGLNIQAYPGTGGYDWWYTGGAGTVFLQSDSQQHGDLIIQSSPDAADGRSTTLPSVGRRAIESFEALADNRYRLSVDISEESGECECEIEVELPVPDSANWETGLVGLQVSLNPEDPAAPLYTILDNDEDSIVIESATPLPDVTGNELLGVYRFDNITIGSNVELRSDDRLYGTRFTVAFGADLSEVTELRSDQVNELGDYVVEDSQVFIGDVIADSFEVTADVSELQVYGSMDVIGDFVAPNTNAEIRVEGDLAVGGSLTSSATMRVRNLTVEGPATYSGWDLYVENSATFLGDLRMTGGGWAEIDGSFTVNGNLSLDNGMTLFVDEAAADLLGDLELDNSASGFFSELTVDGNVGLNHWARLIGNNITIRGALLDMQNSSLLNVDVLSIVSGTLAGASGSEVRGGQIQANSMQLDGATSPVFLRVEEVVAELGITLFSTNVLPRYLSPSNATHLRLSVPDGTFEMDSFSSINFSGVASTLYRPDEYPECSPGNLPQSSHGGLGLGGIAARNCAYDRYDLAELPGSEIGNGAGSPMAGGVVRIEATSAAINGPILVSGGIATNNVGSGGSIDIRANQLSGNGSLQAVGTRSGSRAGGGGRIVIRSDDMSQFTGSYNAFGGTSAGAGTILLGDMNLNGRRLIINNNNINSPAANFSTPIRSIGMHTIAAV